MTSPLPHIDDEVRARIRSRAGAIRRRRRRLTVGSVVAAVLVVAGTATAVITSGASAPTRRVIVGGPCPAAGVSVSVRIGERAAFSVAPAGWVVSGDGTHLATTRLTIDPPGASDGSQGGVTTNQAPHIDLRETTPPAAGGAYPPGVAVSTVRVSASSGTEIYRPAGEGAVSQGTIYWSPVAGAELALEGSAIPPAELLAVADGVRFDPGTIETLQAAVHADVSAATAEHALPADDRRRVTAALSSWAEIDHVRRQVVPGDDYRPAWLVYAPAGPSLATWAIVDATTGKVLVGPTTSKAAWTGAVTDRSQGCEPPLGVLTRSEAAQLIDGSPLAPAGTDLELLTSDAFHQLIPGMSLTKGQCTQPCDPLVWSEHTPNRLASYDGLTGQPEESEDGGTNIPSLPVGDDLDPGPTPTTPPTTPSAPVPTPTSPPTTYPTVGPSPFLPGTGETRPAPAGNGNGPGGSCNGTETGPPCGPGVELHRYYPYTLAERCDQDVRFDGRLWRQALLPPSNDGYENVWMVMNSPTQAGWVGPGAVGMMPAPSTPPTCPQTNPSIPPLAPYTPSTS